MTLHEHIKICGFREPETRFFKPDPRGREYGLFEVVVVTETPDLRISVRWQDRQGTANNWKCIFTELEAFLNWARECT